MEIKTYKLPQWLLIFLITVLVLIILMILLIPLSTLLTGGLGLIGGLMIIGIIELFKSKVVVKEDKILVYGLLKPQEVKFSDIKLVKSEDSTVFLHLKNGKFYKMPAWFGSGWGFQKTINQRIRE